MVWARKKDTSEEMSCLVEQTIEISDLKWGLYNGLDTKKRTC